MCLALGIAFWLQLDNPYWAGTSAGIVAQPGLGASLRKGRFRAIGTVVGGFAIVVLTAVFPQNHLALLVSLALWGAACGCFATILPNFGGYAAALAGYTTAIVFAGIIADPLNVFMQAVWRVTEIGIGILSAELVHALTTLGDARERLARALADIGRGIASGLMETLRAGHDRMELRTARRTLIRRVIALDVTIDEAVGEPFHLRHQSGALRAAQEALFVALSAWRGIANHLCVMPGKQASEIAAALLPGVSKLSGCAWLDDPRVAREICTAEGRIACNSAITNVSSRLVVEGTVRTFHALERVADALVLVSTPGEFPTRAEHLLRVPVLRVPDVLPPMLNGLRIFVTLLFAELFWVVSEWPDGPTMITFTALSVILFSARTERAFPSAVEFAVGCACASVVAVILNLAILPSVPSDFPSLAVVLSLVLTPVGALAAGSWHKPAFVAMATNVVPILAIQNEPSYDATRALNIALAVCAGTVLAAIAIRLLPPLSAATRIQRLLALTLRDLRGLLLGRRRFAQEVWVRLVSNRLAVIPAQANLEQEAQLVAALSVGEAAISLLEARPQVSAGRTLDQAFAELAAANVAAAHASLTRFRAQQAPPAEVEPKRAMHASVQATLIADALQRHPRFFSGVNSP
ncbi:MAG: FUSC family protein [Sinobacteraceae bacterium]|nr:FUSC family protein [Nevskiaceae bacterium]